MASHSNAKIISFTPRSAAPPRKLSPPWTSPAAKEAENARESDEDYRHRMKMNGLSAIVVVVLLVVGEWTLNGFVNSERQAHGCFRAGGSECGTIYTPLAPPPVGKQLVIGPSASASTFASAGPG
jgi:hypothetical protein